MDYPAIPHESVDVGAALDEEHGAFMDTAAIMMNLHLVRLLYQHHPYHRYVHPALSVKMELLMLPH